MTIKTRLTLFMPHKSHCAGATVAERNLGLTVSFLFERIIKYKHH